MKLILFCISIAFYIQLLSPRLLAYTLGEFPSIRPIPCQNRMTGESGVCTFNWSCKNVAHGIHIGSCVDRFFVGACCKIPERGGFGGDNSNSTTSPTTTTQEFSETTKEHSETTKVFIQMESFGKVTDSTIRPTQERLKLPNAANANSNHDANQQIHEIFTDASKDATSSFLLNIKPVLPYTFKTSSTLNNNYLSHKQTSNEQEISVPVTPPVKLIPSPAENYSSITHVPQGSSPVFVSSEDPTTAQTFSHENLTRHELYNLRNPITSLESYILSSISSHDLQNQQWSVPDKKDDHQISIVLEESAKDPSKLNHQTHTEKIPSNTFLSWAYSFLNDEKNNISSYETHSPSEISPLFKPSHPHSPEPQHEVSTYSNLANSTLNEIDNNTPATADILPPTETVVNIDKIHTNFTKFTEPHYPWPSPKPMSSDHSMSTPEAATFGDISRVCGRSRSNVMARIVGGRKSHYLRWPWMISLRRYEGKTFKHKCGAALLNQFWAITAAHCVDGKLPNDVILRLGEHNFHRMDESHPHVERRIYMIVIHPGFDPATYENDLALLRFYEPVRFQANIVPVCLPKFAEDIAGRTAVVTGWGRLSEEGELPGSLHEVQMPILTNKECEDMYSQAGYSETIRDVFVCAGLRNGGLDACEGDSGGPMVLKGERGQWMLVGLISWGMGCAAPRQPGVYTRITKFVDWIDANILY